MLFLWVLYKLDEMALGGGFRSAVVHLAQGHLVRVFALDLLELNDEQVLV